jgi:1,4-alpha-glucan branching enzyme
VKYVEQNKTSNLFDGVYWSLEEPYKFKHERPPMPATPRIYECHVGMSSVHGKVSNYRDFAMDVLPRIKASGYNII